MATAEPVTEEEISCPVCFETFDNQDHEPKRLTCPHSVCDTCVRRLPSPRCPICKLEITLPINELARDLSILRLLQSHTCSECDKLGELRTCKRCEVRLCEICEKKHRTSEHCKIFMNIKTMEKKMNTEAIRKITTENAASEGENEKRIDEMFKRLREELDAQQRQVRAAVRSASELNENARKIKAAPELMTRANLLLESTEVRKQELKAMIDETENVARLMDDPPVVNRTEKLVETLRSDLEKLMSEIKKFGNSIKIHSELLPDIHNLMSFEDVKLPNYETKRRVKRTILLPGEKLGNIIWSLAECSESGRIFVGIQMIRTFRIRDTESQIHVYEDWKLVKTIPVDLQPSLLLVHEGRLHVVHVSKNYCSILALDSRTGNQLYEHDLSDTTMFGKHPAFFADQLGGNFYCFSRHEKTVSEWSLKGQLIRRIKLTNSPVEFSQFDSKMTVSSRHEYSIAGQDGSVHVFSDTGQYQHTIRVPEQCHTRCMTTDYQDNLLICESQRTNDGSNKHTVRVYDKDHRPVDSIDLSGLEIYSLSKMIVTKTGDLVVVGSVGPKWNNKLFVL